MSSIVTVGVMDASRKYTWTRARINGMTEEDQAKLEQFSKSHDGQPVFVTVSTEAPIHSPAPLKKFWLVWSVQGTNPKYQHASEESAIKEANRLASLYRASYFVMECLGVAAPSVMPPPTIWSPARKGGAQ